MDTLTAARSQMAMSLAFHIVFAVIGMAMPVLMVVSESALASHARRRVSRSHASAGREAPPSCSPSAPSRAPCCRSNSACSGRRSWPMPAPSSACPSRSKASRSSSRRSSSASTSTAGRACRRRSHLLAGVVVAVSGALSGVFVISANAWMNTPAGFRSSTATPVDIDPIAAMLNPAAGAEVLHMLARRVRGGRVRRRRHSRAAAAARSAKPLPPPRPRHRPFSSAAPAALVQPLSGDFAARIVARHAARQARRDGGTVPHRTRGVHPGRRRSRRGLGHDAVRDRDSRRAQLARAYGNRDALVRGLDEFPTRDRPPVAIVHMAFQIMVAIGGALALLAAVVRVAGRQASGSCRRPDVSARARGRDAVRFHRRGSGLGRHRGGPAALDHREPDADVRGRDVRPGAHDDVHGVHRAVRASVGVVVIVLRRLVLEAPA